MLWTFSLMKGEGRDGGFSLWLHLFFLQQTLLSDDATLLCFWVGNIWIFKDLTVHTSSTLFRCVLYKRCCRFLQRHLPFLAYSWYIYIGKRKERAYEREYTSRNWQALHVAWTKTRCYISEADVHTCRPCRRGKNWLVVYCTCACWTENDVSPLTTATCAVTLITPYKY